MRRRSVLGSLVATPQAGALLADPAGADVTTTIDPRTARPPSATRGRSTGFVRGTRFWSWFEPDTIQTFEVKDVTI